MSSSSAEPAVRCVGLTCRFGDVTAVDDVSFVVDDGEVVGLLGPNGAGKTTTIRVLTTLLPPSAGSARIFGIDVVADSMRARRLLGYVPQQLSIDGQLTGYENVWLFTRLFDIPRAERAGRAAEALELMGLSDVADRMASTFSGGMIRRLELAQALVNRPRLLILDEPTVGLDPIARDSVWTRVRALRRELGTAVLLTTHYMEEADALCDRVALLHHGRIRTIGAPANLKRDQGPGATLEDVFRAFAGSSVDDGGGDLRGVRATRRDARRAG